MMGGVVRGIRQSIRSLVHSPGFAVPALLILGIGMTAATAIFTVVDSVVFRPLDYPDPGRLVLVCEEHPRIPPDVCIASPANTDDFRTGTRAFSELGFARSWQYSLDDGQGVEGVHAGLATGGFFRALGVRPEVGRLFTDEELGPDHPVVLLGHAFWMTRYGGDRSVVGRTVRLDGDPFEVVGVLPRGFEAPFDMEGAELWVPPYFRLTDAEVRGWRGFRAVGRLAPGETLASATDQVKAVYAGIATEHEEVDDAWRVRLRGLQDAVVGSARTVMLAFLGAAGLLLLIVCANVANLLLARGLGRRRELAVRAALGAERGRLVLGILGESLVLTGFATVLALILAGGATRLLLVLAPPGIPRLDEVAMDGRVLAFAVLLSAVATMAFSVLPALRVTAWDLAQTIKAGGGGREASSSGRLRTGLVVAELALSVVLLAGAALLVRSFTNYTRWDPGFAPDGVLTVSAFMSPGTYPQRTDLVPFYRQAEAAIAAVPGVVSVSSASAGPLFGGGDGATPFATEAWDGTAPLPSGSWFDVGPGYFSTLGIPVLQGREITEEDQAGAEPAVVVNETLARMAWPGGESVGRTLRLPERDQTLRVVGVVADVPPLTPGEPAPPEMYWSNRQLPRWATFFVVRSSGDPLQVAGAVSDALLALDPAL
ncbi:MAG: ABC transporter permease, partial [Gemmatimonadota bacterium]